MKKKPLTLTDLKTMTDAIITPDEAAPILKSSGQYIRTCARQKPEALGFPVILIGNRVKIPRVAFINFLEGKQTQ